MSKKRKATMDFTHRERERERERERNLITQVQSTNETSNTRVEYPLEAHVTLSFSDIIVHFIPNLLSYFDYVQSLGKRRLKE
jgi:hypothetical protein